jgi:predicted ATP-binding protein involved in virulence
VNDLKRTFPKIQFICTTHSPQIIGEVLPNELMILDNGISHSPESSIGVDSNRILQELMNAPTRNEKVQNQMDAISLLIDEESFEDARSKIELLKKTIGENDAEIVHFESIMTFLE